ncbi:MAG: exosortase/archaeosortase family protein, partial [Myxococcota bacterium]
LAAWIALPRLAPTLAPEGAGLLAGDEMLAELEGERPAPLRIASIPAWLCLAAYFLVFAKTLAWFYQNWTMGIWQNGHGLFVPVVMVALGVRALRGERWRESESSPWGVLVVGIALAFAVIDIPLQTRYLGALGFMVGLFGLALTFLGARRTRKLLLPLALGVFMVPIPFSLSDHVFLRLATAIASVPILRMAGFSVVREYTVLLFPEFTLDISTACSGFSTLYAGVFFGVVLAAFTRPGWRQFLVLGMILPLALLANICRAVFLVEVTSLYGTGVLATDLHPASGAATFVLVIGGLALVAGRRSLRRVFA